jgi:N-acetylneuraminate synthase/N,N'-diacetyllegionaminate synthase
MRKIGYDQPCFIIAEAGINHNGSLEQAKYLAEAALLAEADAVKFQTFTEEEIGYPNISYEDTIALKEYCDKIGILFLSTPHSYSAIELLKSLVPMYKVASPFVYDYNFIQRVLGQGLPTIVSFNESARHNDIMWLMERDVYPLHTVCRYPANDPLMLRYAARQECFWQRPWGYSDHCIGIMAVLDVCESVGAAIVEKHIKLNQGCVDAIHSVFPGEFKTMVRRIREMEMPKAKAPEAD